MQSQDLIDRINSSLSSSNSCLIPEQWQNPTKLARAIWQDIWMVSGATPENCLYTFVELFIFKYLSDLNVLTGRYSFTDLMSAYGTNTEEEVLKLYADTIRPKIKELFPLNTQDNTTIINGTIFVSKDEKAVEGYSSTFRKVLQRFEAEGTLSNIHHDFLSHLFESFLKESLGRKNWGQFFTPLKVVRSIIKMVEIRPNMTICDPACGVGKFLLEPVLSHLEELYPIRNGRIEPQITIHGFDKGFDREEQKTIILAKANMLIYLSSILRRNPTLTKDFARLFNESFRLQTNSILGTLRSPVIDKYDLVLTNPPYVTSGSSNLKEEIRRSGLSQFYDVPALGVEGLFMQWIVRALKPGGQGLIVIPDGILLRDADAPLRALIRQHCIIDAIISLPLNTFFKTSKKTYILALTKKRETNLNQTQPVFTYLVSEIGETRDIYRFDMDENHLSDAVEYYNSFKNARELFTRENREPRCKIQPIERFIPDNNWLIDKWWSKSEKESLGIHEKNTIATMDEFNILLDEISNTLQGYQEAVSMLGGSLNEL